MKKLGEKIKGIFAKAGDEAAKVVDESGAADTPAAEEVPKWAQKFMGKVEDAMTQIASMSQPSKMGDEEEEAKDEDKEDKEDKAKDADMPPWADAICKRLDALEGKGADEDKKDDASDEDMEAEDDDMEAMDADEDESEDDDFEETPASKSGDDASRIEILAPGSKFSGKHAKRRALMKAYESKDNKGIIMTMNGGKAIDLKKASQKTIDHLFVGASEVIGLYRTKDFTKWKQVRDSQTQDSGAGEEMTPERINEINKKHYEEKGVH